MTYDGFPYHITIPFTVGMLLGGLLYRGLTVELADAQKEYAACMALQAPQRVCIEKYLLPPPEVKP